MSIPNTPEGGADAVAADQLISFVRRIESIEDRIRVENEDKSEVYKEARGNGFDTKVIRKVVAKRRLGSAEREEQDELFDLYWNAIHGVVSAHVEIIEEIPPHDEDGVILETSSQAQTGGDHGSRQVADDQLIKTEAARPDGVSAAVNCDDDMAAGAGASAGGGSDVSASDVEVVAPRRTHDPATHFLNSDGLVRLHGCRKPDSCGASTPRANLCFSCSVKAGEGVAA